MKNEAKIDPSDFINLPADETIKLVFGSDRKALIQFINSVFKEDYDIATAQLAINNANFINS